MSNPTFGSRAGCSACGQEIEFDGEAWRHIGDAQPRHIATPGAPLARPAAAPAPLLDVAGALAAAVTWVDGQNAGPDDPEPFILELAGPYRDGWSARIVWEHHDGPIGVYAASGLPLAEGLRRLIADLPPDPAREPAEHPATVRDAVARLEAERDAAVKRAEGWERAAVRLWEQRDAARRWAAAWKASAKRGRLAEDSQGEIIQQIDRQVRQVFDSLDHPMLTDAVATLVGEYMLERAIQENMGRFWAEQHARQTTTIADLTRQALEVAAQAAALLRCYVAITPGTTEAETFAAAQAEAERILEVVDAAIDVAGLTPGPAWRLAESLPALREKVQALLDGERRI